MASKQIEPIDDVNRGEAIAALVIALENAKQIDEDGVEYWPARTLEPLLGYKR